jgi:hypothetical protein
MGARRNSEQLRGAEISTAARQQERDSGACLRQPSFFAAGKRFTAITAGSRIPNSTPRTPNREAEIPTENPPDHRNQEQEFEHSLTWKSSEQHAPAGSSGTGGRARATTAGLGERIGEWGEERTRRLLAFSAASLSLVSLLLPSLCLSSVLKFSWERRARSPLAAPPGARCRVGSQSPARPATTPARYGPWSPLTLPPSALSSPGRAQRPSGPRVSGGVPPCWTDLYRGAINLGSSAA